MHRRYIPCWFVVSTEVSRCFIDDGHEPSGPSDMMMRELHHVNYNYIIDCKLYDKKERMCN